ncbi:bifunctional ADP-dependent NAD(P)H-hydrate dehydratase/NAD(P)H-hydrate epimerase [Candidatus Cloacimonadaceae bacterium]
MSYVLSPEQMKRVDERAINELGIPSRVLMEIAGKGCADYIRDQFSEHLNARIAILHGAGNNSGDGFVIARWLDHYGFSVALVCVHEGSFTPEAKENYEICQKLKIPTFRATSEESIDWLEDNLFSCSMIIDAIFGIGFKGELSGYHKKLFSRLCEMPAKMIAVDVPSGMNAATGCSEQAFKADCTLAIHALKIGMLLGPAKHFCGKLATIPLGVPTSFNDDVQAALLIDKENYCRPKRFYNAHKGNYGHVAVIGGSLGFTGSVIMSSKAALRAGAGLVRLHSRMDVQQYYLHLPPEIMFIPIVEDEDSEAVNGDFLALIAEWADSIVIGPGLGLDAYAHTVLKSVLMHSKVPTVVDADAIRLIATDNKLVNELEKPNILLTPHWGEFCALAKLEREALRNDVLGCLQSFTGKTGAKILLKSDTSIFSDGERLLINTSGNDGLATGGSGDVLSGIIASFAAQGMELGLAAINASYLMGKTAEFLARKRYPPSILPSDIIENLFMKDV